LHLLYTIPGIGKTAILSILISAIFAVFAFGVDIIADYYLIVDVVGHLECETEADDNK